MVGVRTALLVTAVLGATMGGALACSCERPANARTHDEVQAWRLERANDVVQGRIAEVWGGEVNGERVLLAKMIVSSVVKGGAPPGEMTLVSSLYDGNCGIPGALLRGFSSVGDIALQVAKVPGDEKKYQINLCGYYDFMVRKVQPSR